MSVDSQSERIRAGAVIYLASNRPLRLPDFFSAFRNDWPAHSLEKTAKEPRRAFFRADRSDFSLELHHSQVPQAITEPVANSTLHWPAAEGALARHVAYLELAGSPANQSFLTLACDMTRAIASLLAITDSFAVCWLNGPALNQAKTFLASAREMFATGLYPLTLWTAVRWEADSQSLVTHGMAQFGAPELVLRQQPDAAPLMVDYVLQMALSLLISRHPIAGGETLAGPHGRIEVKTGTTGASARRMLILEPVG
jgi:hypothetical protein